MSQHLYDDSLTSQDEALSTLLRRLFDETGEVRSEIRKAEARRAYFQLLEHRVDPILLDKIRDRC